MITVITGLICAGKSTIANILMEWGCKRVIEYTTRPVRVGEKDGVDYHFVDDSAFDKMNDNGEFAETLIVQTEYGLWKYGARKEDMLDGYLLVCGPRQVKQMLDAGIPMLSVLLDIAELTAYIRARNRNTRVDSSAEVKRRIDADRTGIDEIRDRVTMVLNAEMPAKVIAKAINDKRLNPEENIYCVDKSIVTSAQPMSKYDLELYLKGDNDLKPYLRMRGNGMPKNPINQIAWLLLQGSGCGFCKVCREKPCGIQDGEKCTMNIANYIRECVHAEDAENHKED